MSGANLVRPGAALLLSARRMARCDPPWWWSASERAEWSKHGESRRRESLAMRMASETARADGGATRQAHWDDVSRVALFATMLRNDWTPAAVVAWFDGLDTDHPAEYRREAAVRHDRERQA